jgi:hypothetical protein
MRWAALAALALYSAALMGQQAAVFRLAGTVIDDSSNAPLPGAEVQVSPVGKPDLIEVAVADAAGRFQFDNLFAGKYHLSAAHAGYLQSAFRQHGSYSTAIVTGPSLDNTHIVFPLTRKASIGGRLADQDGEPVPNATVYLLRHLVVDGLRVVRTSAQGRTGNDGRYTIGNLQPGEYFVAVAAQPWYAVQMSAMGRGQDAAERPENLDVAYPLTFYPGVADDRSAAQLKLSAGAHAQADLSLTAVPAAHVTIERAQGANTNARLQLITHWGERIRAGGMFFSGRGQTLNVAPGRYRLTAGWRDAAGRHSIRRTIEVRGNMTIDPTTIEDHRSVTAVMAGARMNGRLRPGSLALRNLDTLEMLPPVASEDQTVRWPAEELTADRYELVFNGPEDLYVAGIQATNAKVTGRVVELGTGAPVQLKVSLARGRSSMTGRVIRNGAAVAGAMVLLLPEGFEAPGLIRRDQSDGDGTFSLTNITPGRYLLVAVEANDELEYAKPEAMQAYLSRAKKIAVEPGRKYDETVQYADPE